MLTNRSQLLTEINRRKNEVEKDAITLFGSGGKIYIKVLRKAIIAKAELAEEHTICI